MEKQAYNAERLVRSIWDTMGEPAMQKWVKSVDPTFELGPFTPKGNLLDHLKEQDFRGMQTQIMRDAASNDAEPVKLLKGLHTLTGGEWGPGQQAQAETIRGGFAELSPYLMRWAPEWYDMMHGSTGSQASFANAIAETHKHDSNMTAELAVEMADQFLEKLRDAPMMHRGFSNKELGEIYRGAAKRGLVGRNADVDTQIGQLTPIIGAMSAARDSVGPMGYDTSDIDGLWGAVDNIVPSTGYDFERAERDIRVGKYLSERGGMMGAATGGAAVGTGGVSLAQLNANNKQLLGQAGSGDVGNMLAATSRMVGSGMIQEGTEAANWLQQVKDEQLDYFKDEDWMRMMQQSGVSNSAAATIRDQRVANERHMDSNPQLAEAVRAAQPKFDHAQQFAAIDRRFQGNPWKDELVRGQRIEAVRRWGYEDMNHYNQLHGSNANNLTGVMRKARQNADEMKSKSHLGWAGPVERVVDEFKTGTPTLGSVGAAALGGVRAPDNQPAPAAVPETPKLLETPKLPELPKLPEIKTAADRGADARPVWRKIVEKRAVRGVPDRNNFGDPSDLKAGELVDMFLQHHKAQRAGDHYDYRIGTPATQLYSFATKPAPLPAPGEKRFMRQQPLHSYQYGGFSGTIGSGYGKGEVRSKQKSKIKITQAGTSRIEYTTMGDSPERFILLKPKNWRDRNWLLINVTKQQSKPVPPEKVMPVLSALQLKE